MAVPRRTSEVTVEMRMKSPAIYATMTEVSPITLPFLYAPMMEIMRRIVGRRRRRDRTRGSEYKVSIIVPRTLRISALGSMPIAVQSPERKPSPMTNCQI
jgi:hypothetical protein